jgi:hypothetical protein
MHTLSMRRGFALLIASVIVVTGQATGAAGSTGSSSVSTPSVAGASNTGVPAGTTLTKRYGDVKITRPGTVIDGLDVHGVIWVEAADVTIRNTIVRGRPIQANTGLINAGGAAVKNLLIEDVELAPRVRSVHWSGIYGGNFTMRRADIHDVVDAVHLYRNDVKVYDSWLHDLSHFDYDPWHKGPSKEDDVEIVRGERIDIRGNTMSGANNAVLMVTQGMGRVRDLTFSDNVISGGACSVNITQRGGAPIQGIAVTGNTFGASRYNCNVIVDAGTRPLMDISGNRRTDGRRLTVMTR